MTGVGVVLAAFGALTTFKGLLLLGFISGHNFFTLLSGYHYLGGGEGLLLSEVYGMVQQHKDTNFLSRGKILFLT